eukprot:1158324-Pelagomonas_calceolata.AAC.2
MRQAQPHHCHPVQQPADKKAALRKARLPISFLGVCCICSKLRSCNAVDFDDLLGLTVALLKRKDVQSFYNNKFKCVLVDEFQVRMLCAGIIGTEQKQDWLLGGWCK